MADYDREFFKTANAYNDTMIKLVSVLHLHSGGNSDLGQMKTLLKAFTHSTPNDLVLVSGGLIYLYRDHILREDTEALLSEDYSRHIVPGTIDSTRQMIVRLIDLIKKSWLSMKESDRLIVNRYIKTLLAHAADSVVWHVEHGHQF